MNIVHGTNMTIQNVKGLFIFNPLPQKNNYKNRGENEIVQRILMYEKMKYKDSYLLVLLTFVEY